MGNLPRLPYKPIRVSEERYNWFGVRSLLTSDLGHEANLGEGDFWRKAYLHRCGAM
jgi:hypothetical protein